MLLVSDIDRTLPGAFSDGDINAHGINIPAARVRVGSVSVPVSALQGAGVYGLALRGVRTDGVELNGAEPHRGQH